MEKFSYYELLIYSGPVIVLNIHDIDGFNQRGCNE